METVTSPFTFITDAVYDNVIAPYANPSRDKLLPDHPPQLKGRERPTLVISLDGTLIESQWSRQFGWRYIKRPGVDEFLAQLAPLYELVLWTDCLSSADTVIDKLDPRRTIRHRLYRDATTYSQGHHRKDLGALNRDLDRTLIIDCSNEAFSMQPKHGICISPYSSEADPQKEDKQLKRLIPFLQYLAYARHVGLKLDAFSDELHKLAVSTTFDDNGDAFEQAVQARFAELKAQGALPLPGQGGRRFGSYGGGGGGGGTIWDRLGLRRGPSAAS